MANAHAHELPPEACDHCGRVGCARYDVGRAGVSATLEEILDCFIDTRDRARAAEAEASRLWDECSRQREKIDQLSTALWHTDEVGCTPGCEDCTLVRKEIADARGMHNVVSICNASTGNETGDR